MGSSGSDHGVIVPQECFPESFPEDVWALIGVGEAASDAHGWRSLVGTECLGDADIFLHGVHHVLEVKKKWVQ